MFVLKEVSNRYASSPISMAHSGLKPGNPAFPPLTPKLGMVVARTAVYIENELHTHLKASLPRYITNAAGVIAGMHCTILGDPRAYDEKRIGLILDSALHDYVELFTGL